MGGSASGGRSARLSLGRPRIRRGLKRRDSDRKQPRHRFSTRSGNQSKARVKFGELTASRRQYQPNSEAGIVDRARALIDR
jgi:hypothetical protein